MASPLTRCARRVAATATLFAAAAAWGQAPVLKHLEGSAATAPAGEREWIDIEPRHVWRAGERLWSDAGARSEWHTGGHVLRIAGPAQAHLMRAQPQRVQLSVRSGSVAADVGPLAAGEVIEIHTPQLTWRALQPGRYRVDVDPRAGTTRVTVTAGAARVAGEPSQAMDLPAGQRLVFRDRTLALAAPPERITPDAFDRWTAARARPAAAPVGATAAVSTQLPRAAAAPAPVARRAEDAQRDAWRRQQQALAERWRREHEQWLRYQEGRGPAPSAGIPARRIR